MAPIRFGLLWGVGLLLFLTACSQPNPQVSTQIGPTLAVSTATISETPTTKTPLTSTIASTHLATAVTPTSTNSPVPTLAPTSTNTPLPTRTLLPTVTPSPTATFTPIPAATATAVPITVNNIPVANFISLSPEVITNSQAIFANGQKQGRNPNVFSKVGDSVTLTDHYLTRFDSGFYTLGEYAYLQPAIDHYAGSFERYGVATRIGLHAWSLFDPLWANKEWCLPDEDMIACEIRLNNPSVLLIRLGSNDSAGGAYFEDNMRLLVEYAIDRGIIPVLATKPDRFEGPDNRNNLAILKLAAEYQIPLWDFDVVAASIPNKGLGGDLVHMTMADANDYTNPDYFERGYPMNDLTALMMLHAIYTEVVVPQTGQTQ